MIWDIIIMLYIHAKIGGHIGYAIERKKVEKGRGC